MSTRLQALRDLGSRYLLVFRQAWAHRHSMETVPRLSHEAQFLPAALSLQETPVSPAPRVAMWLILAFAGIALIWSWQGRIDVVATAHGKVIPTERSKTIQPMETASVRAIHVTDGQLVTAGQILVELDATVTTADHERVRSELVAARLEWARAQAMLMLKPGETVASLNRPAGVEATEFAQAKSMLQAQVAEYRAKLERLQAELVRRDAEKRTAMSQIAKVEQTLPMTRQRAKDYKDLVEQQFASQHGFMEKEQARVELEADLVSLRSKLKEVEAAIIETHSQVTELQALTRRDAADRAMQAQLRVSSLEQELAKADVRGRQTRLTAPVDGTVQQLAVHTLGGVVIPAQALMVIVPKGDALEIEAMIENKDAGFVRAGQQARVKVETFQYTKYGTLDAEIASVSNDAIVDEKRGLLYSTRIRLKSSELNVDGSRVALSPGMAVTAEVKTGTRRPIEYFLSPLMQTADESLRER